MGHRSLDSLFAPRSVAVIGASRDPSKVGGSVLANLRAGGFEGRIIPINRQAAMVQGLASAKALLAVDEPIDLAVITVAAPGVLPALEECVAKGVPAAVVISAGFRESGPEGLRREGELRSWLRENPIRVLGPNCLGWIRPSRRLNATFAPGMPDVGSIAFISHSGALAVAILDWARDRRLGFSLFASLGNQADITESDVLDAVAADAETRVIVGYVEGVADGRRFFETLRRAAAMKPVVLFKAGHTAEGARAVSSHTGALAGSDQAFDAAVKQAGAIRVHTVEALFDLARGLVSQPLPRGKRILVVTNGGGLGIVSTDAARDAGLEVAALDDPVRGRVAAVLPSTASSSNPVDLVGDADAVRYSDALHALGPGAADMALVVMTAQAATDAVGVARAIVGATRDWPIPIAAAFVGGARVAAGARVLEEARVPCYPFPEPAVKTLAGMATMAARRASYSEPTRFPVRIEEARHHLGMLREAKSKRLGMLELQPVLEAYGIRCALVHPAGTPTEAGTVAARIGFPVAIKVQSPDISHKTDVGGVRLNLRSADEVTAATRQILDEVRSKSPRAILEGVLIQQMAGAGKELLLGLLHDPQFGPLVMVGFGGVYVEILKDTAARLAPLAVSDAREMVEELRMAPVLHGVRGERPVDLVALYETVCRFAQIGTDLPELVELEVNPLVSTASGVLAVDARASLAEPSR